MQMLVDDIGDVTITNDGATILKLLEVEHPAAKVKTPLADSVIVHYLFNRPSVYFPLLLFSRSPYKSVSIYYTYY